MNACSKFILGIKNYVRDFQREMTILLLNFEDFASFEAREFVGF